VVEAAEFISQATVQIILVLVEAPLAVTAVLQIMTQLFLIVEKVERNLQVVR
jgi:hypothetical protein